MAVILRPSVYTAHFFIREKYHKFISPRQIKICTNVIENCTCLPTCGRFVDFFGLNFIDLCQPEQYTRLRR